MRSPIISCMSTEIIDDITGDGDFDVVVDGVDDWKAQKIGAAAEEILEDLADRWDLKHEITGRTVVVDFGELPASSENSITLPYPEDHRRSILQHSSSEEVTRITNETYPVPAHPLLEEAGHFESRLPDRVERPLTRQLEDITINELFGALAAGRYNESFLDYDLDSYGDNLEIISEMYGDEHVDYVEDILGEVAADVDDAADELGEVDTTGFEDVMQELVADRNQRLRDAPSTSFDFRSYSRHSSQTPQTYSEWFVDYVAYDFVRPLVAAASGEREAEPAIRDARDSAESTANDMGGWSPEDLGEFRDQMHVHASTPDRAYHISRQLARDVLDRNLDADFNYDPSSLVRMTNHELYREFEDYIGEKDDELRDEYGVPSLDIPARNEDSVVTSK